MHAAIDAIASLLRPRSALGTRLGCVRRSDTTTTAAIGLLRATNIAHHSVMARAMMMIIRCNDNIYSNRVYI